MRGEKNSKPKLEKRTTKQKQKPEQNKMLIKTKRNTPDKPQTKPIQQQHNKKRENHLHTQTNKRPRKQRRRRVSKRVNEKQKTEAITQASPSPGRGGGGRGRGGREARRGQASLTPLAAGSQRMVFGNTRDYCRPPSYFSQIRLADLAAGGAARSEMGDRVELGEERLGD